MAINRSTKPQDIIETTQALRLKIVSDLTRDGDEVTDDPKMLVILNQTLRDMDQAALTTRKLDVEEAGVDAASRVANNLSAIYKELGDRHPFEVDKGRAQRVEDEASLLPTINTVPNHTLQGVEELVFEDFVERRD